MEKSKSNKSFIQSKFIFTLINVIWFVIMFILNKMTIYQGDDYCYTDIWGVGINSNFFENVFVKEYVHYNMQTGRYVVHSLDRIFFLFNKDVFNVVNSLVFVAMALLIYWFIIGKGNRNNIILMLIYPCLWIIAPTVGGEYLWQTGSFNYLWAPLISLSLYAFYFRLVTRDTVPTYKTWQKWIYAVLALLYGVICGNTAEIPGGILIVGIIGIWFYQLKIKKIHIYAWEITGFIGTIIGYIILMLSPGNHNRVVQANNEMMHGNIVIEYGYRLIRETYYMMINMWWLWAAFFVLLIISKSDKKWKEIFEDLYMPLLFGLLAFGGIYIMTFTIGYSFRVIVTPGIMLICATGMLLKKYNGVLYTRCMLCLTAFVMIHVFIQIAFGGAGLYVNEKGTINIRTEYIKSIDDCDDTLDDSLYLK